MTAAGQENSERRLPTRPAEGRGDGWSEVVVPSGQENAGRFRHLVHKPPHMLRREVLDRQNQQRR
ncbi:MAG TPA: hypothetical protein VLB73_00650 [Patescibacteria group bacterium]|nr:hypothetical protein [Patescibacteria group bacterium]